MSIDLSKAGEIAGFIGACLVDTDTGLMMTSHGGGTIDLELASTLISGVLKAKNATVEGLKLDDEVEDILVSLGKQIHVLRPLGKNATAFLYVVLDRKKANLGMSRLQIRALERALTLEMGKSGAG